MNPETKIPWYFRRRYVILILIGIAPLSPLALPLLWWSPRFSTAWKVGATVLVLVLTWFVIQGSASLLKLFYGRIHELKELGLLS
jgi:hypothetical protein